jgi:hypothetical protein
MDALIHLEAATAAFILGSTEPHYTPSKVYQSVLSKKPILAVLHEASSACTVIKESGAGLVLDFAGEEGVENISTNFLPVYKNFIEFIYNYDYDKVNKQAFDQYSAKAVTKILADALDKVVNR